MDSGGEGMFCSRRLPADDDDDDTLKLSRWVFSHSYTQVVHGVISVPQVAGR